MYLLLQKSIFSMLLLQKNMFLFYGVPVDCTDNTIIETGGRTLLEDSPGWVPCSAVFWSERYCLSDVSG